MEALCYDQGRRRVLWSIIQSSYFFLTSYRQLPQPVTGLAVARFFSLVCLSEDHIKGQCGVAFFRYCG